MRSRINLEGPPGTGKTTKLIGLLEAAVLENGAARVGAITYTRSAAEELRLRAGAVLRLGSNADTLRKRLPYIGTIHSIAYRALGAPKMVDAKAIKDFANYAKLPGVISDVASPDEVDGFWTPEDLERDGAPGVGMLLKIISAARHRGTTITQAAVTLVPPNQQMLYRPEWFEAMAQKYARFKRDSGLLDYDDLLEAGAELTIPVRVLLDDEAQDQSGLMWRVVDAWAKETEVAIFAGDPWQALYHFSGGDPQLFLQHPGEWRRLGTSHRLDDDSAAYSYRVLELAGWRMEAPPVRGLGGHAVDGTTLYLARTNALVQRFADELTDAGVPFLTLRGRSPWDSPTAEAYRIIARLRDGAMVQSGALPTVYRAAASGFLPRSVKGQVEKAAAGNYPISYDEANRLLNIDHFQWKSADVATYMEKIQHRHGYRALFARPVNTVSTIHAAKGREADHVVVMRDWGMLPGRIANSGGEGAKLEGCCAYVAVTRHRATLTLVDYGLTPQYLFPTRVRDGRAVSSGRSGTAGSVGAVPAGTV